MSTFRGLEAETLDNGIVAVTVIPALGGRVVSIKDIEHEREWLSVSQNPAAYVPTDGTDAIPHLSAGWNECFPTITPCSCPGAGFGSTEIPTHGELWFRPWRSRDAANAIRLEIDGLRFPYRFERKITADGRELRVAYRLTNSSSALRLTGLWALHLVLKTEEGDRIALPGDTRALVEFSTRSEVPPGMTIDWPIVSIDDRSTHDLSALAPSMPSSAFKLFVESRHRAGAALADTSSRWLGVSYGNDVSSRLGLWLNNGGWPPDQPLCHVALEPTTSSTDSLPTAVEQGTAIELGPATSVEWTVRIVVGHGAKSLDRFIDDATVEHGPR